MEKYPTDPNEVHKGQQVRIETNDGEFYEGTVSKIITRQHNFLGIKVTLENGKVGRVKHFTPETTSEGNPLEKKFRQVQNHQEGQTLEFKASFLFDRGRYEYDKQIAIFHDGPHSIAKTIAAFANSRGGTLYVGIRDNDRQILGLQYDYDILKENEGKKIVITKGDTGIHFTSNGEFQTSLKRVMDQLFLDKFDYMQNTTIDVFNVDGQDLCVIEVKSSKRPVILRNNGKPEFYVRHADQSEQYENIARFCDYWCEHLCELSS